MKTSTNLFEIAEYCLYGSDLDLTLEWTRRAYQFCLDASLEYGSELKIRPIAETVFPERPKLLLPKYMPRRKFDTQEGLAAFFHSLTHIEFVAIYLAWDLIYRFRGLPIAFYKDWLKIAHEEAQHFEMLKKHLQDCFGITYGDLPAHAGLWWHAQDTADNILARLAIVPRCMEARGLDVTPVMIERFRRSDDEESVRILSIILRDEIGHVERGSYWFNVFALAEDLDPEQKFKDLLLEFYKGKPKGPFDRQLRLQAGFKHSEIDWLEAQA